MATKETTPQPQIASGVGGHIDQIIMQESVQQSHMGPSSLMLSKSRSGYWEQDNVDEDAEDDDDGERAELIKDWGTMRKCVLRASEHPVCTITIGLVIALNTALVVVEADTRASCADPDADSCPANAMLYKFANYVFLSIYCVELCVGVYVYRETFLKNPWNRFDAVVVIVSIVTEMLKGVLPSVSFLRTLRVIRMMKLARILTSIRELYLIIFGFVGAMKGVFWASMLMFMLLSFWSIFVVELLHPVNKTLVREGFYAEGGDGATCTRCPEAYATVMKTNLTFLQTIIMGDSWGMYSVPLIEKEWWTVFIFVGVIATVVFAAANLVLSVIVDSAARAHEDDIQFQMRQGLMQEKKDKQGFIKTCIAMDRTKDGILSLDELLHGFDSKPAFQQFLANMQLSKKDLPIIFNMMDEDESGGVDYKEFSEQLHRLHCMDTRTMLVFIKYYVMTVKKYVKEGLRNQIRDRTSLTEMRGDIKQIKEQMLKFNSVVTTDMACNNDDENKAMNSQTDTWETTLPHGSAWSNALRQHQQLVVDAPHHDEKFQRLLLKADEVITAIQSGSLKLYMEDAFLDGSDSASGPISGCAGGSTYPFKQNRLRQLGKQEPSVALMQCPIGAPDRHQVDRLGSPASDKAVQPPVGSVMQGQQQAVDIRDGGCRPWCHADCTEVRKV